MSETPNSQGPPAHWNKRLREQFWVRNECGRDRMELSEAKALPRLPITAILDRIRSAHNVGSMFRTADGANLGELVLCEYTPQPPHKHLNKTALESTEVVPWRHSESVFEAIDRARENGRQVLAVELSAESVALEEFDLKFPLAIVMGNEAEGLSAEVMARCDATVHLPMRGLKNSLNVSVAFGIVAYELARRCEKQQDEKQQSENEFD